MTEFKWSIVTLGASEQKFCIKSTNMARSQK